MVSFLSAAWALGPTIVTADASVKAAAALKSERRSMVSSLFKAETPLSGRTNNHRGYDRSSSNFLLQ
jgi:hypothetical protein